ncbi:hypothetical protein ABW21_db0205320 [Orbilia brochopaga]|nr:hypothetical protein ABW21_db0205320 [Drechslerella brochopaga]
MSEPSISVVLPITLTVPSWLNAQDAPALGNPDLQEMIFNVKFDRDDEGDLNEPIQIDGMPLEYIPTDIDTFETWVDKFVRRKVKSSKARVDVLVQYFYVVAGIHDYPSEPVQMDTSNIILGRMARNFGLVEMIKSFLSARDVAKFEANKDLVLAFFWRCYLIKLIESHAHEAVKFLWKLCMPYVTETLLEFEIMDEDQSLTITRGRLVDEVRGTEDNPITISDTDSPVVDASRPVEETSQVDMSSSGNDNVASSSTQNETATGGDGNTASSSNQEETREPKRVKRDRKGKGKAP